MNKIPSYAVAFAAVCNAAQTADYGHCNVPNGYLFTELSMVEGAATAVFSASSDGVMYNIADRIWVPDLSKVAHPVEFDLPLENARVVMFVFKLTKKSSIRAELISDSRRPNGELRLELYTADGQVVFCDIDNGMYRHPSWSGTHERAVPRIESMLEAGLYTLAACNNYAADSGRLRVGRTEYAAVTRKTTNPFASDNGL